MIEEIYKKAQSLNINIYALCSFDKGQWSQLRLRESNKQNNVYSVSKSITSLIVGTLIAEGIMNPEDKVVEVLGNLCSFPECWGNVTVAHLLTHTTGYGEGCLDIDADDISQWEHLDYLQVAASQPLVYEPGKKMTYSDSNYYLLSRMIAQKSGKYLQDLARERLFLPLGITGVAWATCPNGHAMGGTGLFLGVEDMAKIGVLMLYQGNWKGQQLVPSSWIEDMRKRHIVSGHSDKEYYGYGVWRRSDTEASIISGSRGQRIFVLQESERVIAWQGCTRSDELGVLIEELIKLDKEA